MFKSFKTWVQNKWFEHKKEVLSWEHKVVDYDFATWFRKNKWFLRKLFKEEK